jgi:hypothetical protein
MIGILTKSLNHDNLLEPHHNNLLRAGLSKDIMKMHSPRP